MARFEELQEQLGGLDPLEVPVPGESLTADPEQRQPFEQPPIHTDMNEAVEDLFFRMTEKESMDQLINLIRSEVPLEDIAQVVLFSGFREGAFTPDLMLNMIEPAIYILIWMADYAEIEPVLAPDDEFDFGDEEGEVAAVEELQAPESVTPSLLTKIKTRLDTEGSPEEAEESPAILEESPVIPEEGL